MYWAEKNRKCEIELRFLKIDFEYSVLKRVSIFRASFNIPSSKHQLSKITNRDVPIISSMAHAVDTSRDFGVMVDSRLTMADQAAAICRGAYYQLRQLRSVTRSLSPEAAKAVVQAFITTRLNYCNSLLYGITDSLFRRLQSVQNASAHFISGARTSDHITLVLRQLH